MDGQRGASRINMGRGAPPGPMALMGPRVPMGLIGHSGLPRHIYIYIYICNIYVCNIYVYNI